MMAWWQGVASDFADLPGIAEVLRVSVRLVMAAALGGVLGWEREAAGKEAGLRTHMLVSLGAALFVLIPQQAGMSLSDLSRIIQGLAAGIGFLCAGTILKPSAEGHVQGLTTAAGVWLTAAIGLAAGLGRETSAVLGTVLALAILTALYRLEKHFKPSGKESGPKE